jgi:hypothetical protein
MKFNPGTITDDEVEINEDGMNLNIKIPPKKFSSGKNGFFRQGIYKDTSGKRYRLNLQAFEIE